MFGPKIKLDKELMGKIKRYAAIAGYSSPKEFIVHTLEKEIAKLEDSANDEEVKKRRGHELSEEKMKKIAEIVGIGALRYNIIKVQPEKEIVFKWEEALNFEGNAAPFIQYSHARACSILSKKKDDIKEFDFSYLIHNSETRLIKKLGEFPIIIEDACNGNKPHIITSYLFELASQFNQFYRDCPEVCSRLYALTRNLSSNLYL